MSFSSVFHCLGWAIVLLAALMTLPALAALLNGDGGLAWTFAAAAVLSAFFGIGIALATRRTSLRFEKREGFLFAVLIWVVLALFGALPLHFAGYPGGAVNAFFEAISGLTTTGATAFEELAAVPSAILMWRALLQWGGGLLTVVLAVVLLSHLGVGGMELFQSALPRGEGAALPTRMLQTAQDLFWVYVILTLLCAVALWAVGMTAFEALCHAFSTLSTGGFSTRDGGVAAFDNPLAELVLMAFMLVAAMNLTLHWAGFQGRFRAYRDNIEVHYLSVALVILVIAAAGLGVWAEETDFPDGFRGSLFNAISALTTTGFSNAGGGVPIGLPPILIIGLVLVGGAVGSTTGGMRMLRLAVLFKQAQRELLRLLHPHAAVPLKVGPRTVATTTVWGVWSLFFVLILALAATSLVLSLTGLSPEAAVAAAVAAVSNAGPFLPAIEPTAPAYAEMSGTAKLTLAAAMLAGRVELLALLTLANPAYWRD